MAIWRQATLADLPVIGTLTIDNYRTEVEPWIVIEDAVFYRAISHAIIDQAYNAMSRQVCVCEEANKIIAWYWIDRGHTTPYSSEELAEPKFIHIDLALPVKQRIRLMQECLRLWERWCYICAIPVIMSTSIRADQAGFMRLHQRAGYTVRGSFAFKRVEYVE